MGDDRRVVASVMRWHKTTYAVGLIISALLCGAAGWFAATRFEKLLPDDRRAVDDLPRLVRACADEPLLVALLAVPALVAAVLALFFRKRTALFVVWILLGSMSLFVLFAWVLYSFLTLLAPHYTYDGTL